MAKTATRTSAQTDGTPAMKIAGLSNRRGGPKLPQAEPQPMWLFTHHPRRWHVRQGKVVPALGRIVLRTGVSGVKVRADGTAEAATAVLDAERRGHQIIPPDIDADQGFGSYCRPVQVVTPAGREATSYVPRWARVVQGAPGASVDEAAYVAWLESLIERGVIEPASTWALEQLRDRLLGDRARLRKRGADDLHVRQVAADLAVVEAALAAGGDA